MTTIKASKATVLLGDTTLNVFLLPDGKTLKWSAKHITDAISIRHSRVAEICATKQAQILTSKGIEVADFSPISLVFEGGKASGYSTEVAFFIWQYEAFKGNELAQALVFASGVETLERRAYDAFSILQSEEDMNQRFIARKDSILQRHFWTDAIKWYLDKNEVTDNYRKFIYGNVSDRLNKGLFGLSAKQIRLQLDMASSENIRDCVNPLLLPDLTFIEKFAATRVQQGLEPMQAINEALSFCNYPVRSPKTSLPTNLT